MIPADARPRLAPKARLRFDRKTERYLLLYPEKRLELNPTIARSLAFRYCPWSGRVVAVRP